MADCYSSLYRFSDEYHKLCQDTGSVKGASLLACYSDYLWFDIDSENLVKAHGSAMELATKIESLDSSVLEHLAIYFSGSKGFHVGVPAGFFGWEPSVDLPRIHRVLAKSIAGDVSIDAAIYEHNRLWRVPNTRHGKSGLYKVPLTVEQFTTWNIDQITKLASNPTGAPALTRIRKSVGLSTAFADLYQQAAEVVGKRHSPRSIPETTNQPPSELQRPCYQALLKGVKSGQRNEAAIRLATAFRKVGYSLEKVLASLSDWNQNNEPPLEDIELEAIAQSAMEGDYDYGCNDDMLHKLCDESCPVLQKQAKSGKDKQKCDSFVTLGDGRLAEMIIDVSGSSFAIYDPSGDGNDGCDGYVERLPGNIIPYPAEKIAAIKAIHFPSAAEPYESEEWLIAESDRYIRKYLAVSDFFHEIIPYYVLLTWNYDRLQELPYLRAIGDYGTGKSRFLKTVGAICYKPMFCMGATSVSSIFRLLNEFRGTLIIDESDFSNSDESHMTIKMLNTGYQKGFPLWRSEAMKNRSFEPQSFDVFGPKLIATRNVFKDQAMESRCLTEHMDDKLRPGIPASFPEEAWEEAKQLRNRLLMFRFKNYYSVKPPDQLLDCKIHPRLAQILYPLFSVIRDPGVRDRLLRFMEDQDAKLKEAKLDSKEGRILQAILDLKESAVDGRLTSQQIADKINESVTNDKFKIQSATVGRVVSNVLGLPKERNGRRRDIVINSPKGIEKLKYWGEQYGLENE
jgi:hypothetical protein